MDPNLALAFLYFVVPVALVLTKLSAPRFTWFKVWALTALSGWLLVNYDNWIDPPHNGLAGAVALSLGWIASLPITAMLWLLQSLVFRLRPRLRESLVFHSRCRIGSDLCKVLIVLLTLFGLFGWISADKAVKIAEHHLSTQGRFPTGTPHVIWSWDGWTVQFGDESGPAIEISRTGRLMGGFGGMKAP